VSRGSSFKNFIPTRRALIATRTDSKQLTRLFHSKQWQKYKQSQSSSPTFTIRLSTPVVPICIPFTCVAARSVDSWIDPISYILQRENSMLTWEGNAILGGAAITEKLTVNQTHTLLCICTDYLAGQTLPFETVEHKVTTLDAQPSSPAVASLIVNVTGLLVVC